MSPRNEEQNQQIKDERRAQILNGALKVFAKNGCAATKIGDIAHEAGVSHGLVYHYFASKEEVFSELVDIAVKGASGSLLQAELAPMPSIEKIRMVASMILKSLDEYEDSAYYFLLMIQAMIRGGGSEAVFGNTELPNDILARMVADGQAQGQIKSGDPVDMAAVFFAAIQGMALYKALEPGFKMPSADILVGMLEA